MPHLRSLTHDVKGKTATRIIPKAFVPQTRGHIAEYQRLRRLTSERVEVNEICQARIGNGETEDDFKKEPLTAELARDVAVELDTLLSSGASYGMDFEAIETAARRQVLALAARAPLPFGRLRRRRQMPTLHLSQSSPHAPSEIP